jgi:hypothetical protein
MKPFWSFMRGSKDRLAMQRFRMMTFWPRNLCALRVYASRTRGSHGLRMQLKWRGLGKMWVELRTMMIFQKRGKNIPKTTT